MRSDLLDKQWALFDDGKYDQAFDRTQAVLEQLPPSERRAAWRLMGMARHAGGSYEQAVDWFRELCQGSDVADDWCRLALAATMARQTKVAADAFEQVRFCHQVSRYGQRPSLYLHIYWYASILCDLREYAAVGSLLNELARAYRRVHQMDSVVLFSRGLPFLSSVLNLAVQCFSAEENYATGIVWLEALAKGLDEPGQRQVAGALRELMEEDGGTGVPSPG